MKVTVLEEHGYDIALRGMAYSYKDRALEPDPWWEGQREKAQRRAVLLAHKDGGHNKFLRQIGVWMDVEASRAWWSEFDTYGVGTVRQSESTMHTLSKRAPTFDDFEEDTPEFTVIAFIEMWHHYKSDVTALKCALPEGFLQRRIVSTNYAALRNILWQREGHRLRYWQVFREAVLAQVEHPELLVAQEQP